MLLKIFLVTKNHEFVTKKKVSNKNDTIIE